jgi:transposase InsO family protein
MQAVKLVKQGWSRRKAARYLGYSHSSIVRWTQRVETECIHGNSGIPTKSSRPQSHPKALSPEVVSAIVAARLRHNRCSEVVYDDLLEQGIKVSLSSVKRTLKRHELLKSRSKWKRYRPPVARPKAILPGALIQMDTIHFVDWQTSKRFYIYTVIDLYSRWAYAEVHDRLNQRVSLKVALRAQAKASFGFSMIQTDNGPEFQRYFHDMLAAKSIALRHSRVRQSNDNAHIERFNRTLQDECLGKYPLRGHVTKQKIETYLDYYNNDRKHLGISLKIPTQVVQRY